MLLSNASTDQFRVLSASRTPARTPINSLSDPRALRIPQMHSNPHIKHAIDIEQYLMEGAYNKVREHKASETGGKRGGDELLCSAFCDCPPHIRATSHEEACSPPRSRSCPSHKEALKNGVLPCPCPRQVLDARTRTPDPLYGAFMENLMTTVRCGEWLSQRGTTKSVTCEPYVACVTEAPAECDDVSH